LPFVLAVTASNPLSEPAIRFEHVTRQYQTGRGIVTALHDATFTIGRGEWVAIVGPSGSGKSTLMNLLAGIDRATAGAVTVNGVELTHLSEERLARWRGRQVGIVFQFFQLMPTLTALENVVLPMELRGRWRGERRNRGLALLDRVGVAGLASSLPSQLSGGEQQRVAIARALVSKPTVMFADEPTGNLDSRTSSEILALLRDSVSSYGQTTVMVTHDAHAAAIADRILFLADGVIVKDLGPSSSHEILEALEDVTQR
jgi:putative ABC transport system ATP-binding protein